MYRRPETSCRKPSGHHQGHEKWVAVGLCNFLAFQISVGMSRSAPL
jgi:hypothetical protein